jgi:hypothetical protein
VTCSHYVIQAQSHVAPKPLTDDDGIALINMDDSSSSLSYCNLWRACRMILMAFAISCRFTAGVIPRANFSGFERLLWRACRGNVFLRSSEIEEPIEEPATDKKVCS